jgi:hypothetical protein
MKSDSMAIVNTTAIASRCGWFRRHTVFVSRHSICSGQSS